MVRLFVVSPMGYYEDNLHYVNVFLAGGVLRFMKFSCQESGNFLSLTLQFYFLTWDLEQIDGVTN